MTPDELDKLKVGALLLRKHRKTYHIVVARAGNEYVEVKLIETAIYNRMRQSRRGMRSHLYFRWHLEYGGPFYGEFVRVA